MTTGELESLMRAVQHLAQVPDEVLTPEYIAVELANRMTTCKQDWARVVNAGSPSYTCQHVHGRLRCPNSPQENGRCLVHG